MHQVGFLLTTKMLLSILKSGLWIILHKILKCDFDLTLLSSVSGRVVLEWIFGGSGSEKMAPPWCHLVCSNKTYNMGYCPYKKHPAQLFFKNCPIFLFPLFVSPGHSLFPQRAPRSDPFRMFCYCIQIDIKMVLFCLSFHMNTTGIM